MKRMSLIVAISLMLALLITAYSRTPQSGAVKKATVTAQTIASQPAGKPYLIDLIRSGTVYEVEANVNYSQVRVRTSAGEKALSSYRRPGVTGKILLGRADDLSALNYGFPPGGTFQPPNVVTIWKCDDRTKICSCNGPTDCKDLNNKSKCSVDSWTCMQGNVDAGSKETWGCTCSKKA